jgi:ABC-2 type transport system ATP-binding protein
LFLGEQSAGPEAGMMHGMKAVEPPAVAIESVSHFYGARRALDDVSCSIAPSTFAVLLGLNGAGKSTLFSLIMRLYAIQRGRILVFGHDVGRASSEALRMVGVVFQPRTLDLDLSLIQNLMYHAALHGIGKKEARARADDVLARIALSDRAKDKVRSLSGGQMRRVEIARALLHRPRLLVLDEPTVGLDPVLRVDLWQQFTELARDGTTLLVSSHVMDEADHCGDLLLMREGQLVAHTTPTQLREDTGCTSLEDAFLSKIRHSTTLQAG